MITLVKRPIPQYLASGLIMRTHDGNDAMYKGGPCVQSIVTWVKRWIDKVRILVLIHLYHIDAGDHL